MIREAFESGRPLTYVRSSEEQRVASVLREVARRSERRRAGSGLDLEPDRGHASRRRAAAAGSHARSARRAGFHRSRTRAPAIFHLKDFHEPLRDSPEIRRRLRDVYESCLDKRKFVVITSPVRFIPEEVERSLLFVELRPPDLVELVEFLREEARASRRAPRMPVTTCSTSWRARCRA